MYSICDGKIIIRSLYQDEENKAVYKSLLEIQIIPAGSGRSTVWCNDDDWKAHDGS